MSNPNQPKRLPRKYQLLASLGIILFAFVAAFVYFKSQASTAPSTQETMPSMPGFEGNGGGSYGGWPDWFFGRGFGG